MLNSMNVRDRITKLLADTFQDDGMKTGDVNVRISRDGGFTVTMSIEPLVQDLHTQRLFARMYHLPEDFVGSTIKINRKVMKVTSINPSAPKNIVNLKCVETGKAYVCSQKMAQMATRV